MTATLADLPFIYLYVRLNAADKPLFRSKEKGQTNPNQFVPEEFCPVVERFKTAIAAALQGSTIGVVDFEGLRCRVSRQNMTDGSDWICARRISSGIPELNKLGFANHISGHLHTLGLRDGLILISGASGQGKTTTSSALLADYLKSYGGTGIVVEDPVEYMMQGRHGEQGQCFQFEAKTDEEWAACLKRGLLWAPRYIYAGEVRTPKVAEFLMRAATTGHTVITTVDAGSPEDALMGLLYLAEQAMGPSAGSTMAAALTALLHQTMKEDGPFIRYLFTEENAPGDPIRTLIREDKVTMISTYIDRIAARLANQPIVSASLSSLAKTGSTIGAGHVPLASSLPPLPKAGQPPLSSLPPKKT